MLRKFWRNLQIMPNVYNKWIIVSGLLCLWLRCEHGLTVKCLQRQTAFPQLSWLMTEGRGTRGSRPRGLLFSSNGKLPSSVFLRLIHQVLFVTSDSGSSSTWTLRVGLQATPLPLLTSYPPLPPRTGHCCWFCFQRCFFFLLLRVYLCEGRAQRGPFGLSAGCAGQPQNQAGWPAHTGAFHSGARTFCSTVELWERGWAEWKTQT